MIPASPTDCNGAACPAKCHYVVLAAAKLVTLIAGGERCSYCPSWRQECNDREIEARRILSMGDIEDRRAAVARYRSRLGDVAGDRMEECIKVLWGYRRDRQAAAAAKRNAS